MRTSSRVNNVNEDIKVEAFDLKVPDQFKIEPDVIVELPRKHQARIYNVTKDDPKIKEIEKGTAWPQVAAWQVVVVNKDGFIKNNNDYFDRNNHHLAQFASTSPLRVRQYLEEWVLQLSKKKRVMTEESSDD